MSNIDLIAQSASNLSETELQDLIQNLLIQSWQRSNKTTTQKRPFGLAEGLFVVPDNFNEPLSDAWMQDFEGI
jgi:lantibiotic modifying enzyme